MTQLLKCSQIKKSNKYFYITTLLKKNNQYSSNRLKLDILLKIIFETIVLRT